LKEEDSVKAEDRFLVIRAAPLRKDHLAGQNNLDIKIMKARNWLRLLHHSITMLVESDLKIFARIIL
jgi:hypothetical protein